MSLIRYGDTDSSPVIAIDDLEYTYDSGNRLLKVKDNTGNPSGFKEGVYTGAFIYDNYGNLTQDKNKGITAITYNHLNLPKKIEFGSTDGITYLYNANGQKIKKTVVNSPSVSTVNYQGGFHYENGLLKFIATAEGYVNVTTRGYNYVYNYTDHLGNIRLSYTKNTLAGNPPVIVEENNYYPFGLKQKGYEPPPAYATSYKYKYNGKEFQDELGLNVYDYGNRNYQPDLGRFFNIDKFTEKYYNLTTYQYGANNPILYNDIKGDSILIYSKQDKQKLLYNNGNLYSKNNSTGNWEAYNGKNLRTDKKGNQTIRGFLGKAVAALDKIRTGGVAGAELIGDLQDSDKLVTITSAKSSHAVGTLVRWNASNTLGGPTNLSSSSGKSPPFIGLAHELGHAHDALDGTMDNKIIGNIGGKDILGAEYYAMHWENRIRAEQGLNLRTHYGIGNGQVVGQAVDSNGNSLIYTQKQLLPNVTFC
jgi:RHS repeat-associated protein